MPRIAAYQNGVLQFRRKMTMPKRVGDATAWERGLRKVVPELQGFVIARQHWTVGDLRYDFQKMNSDEFWWVIIYRKD